MSCDRDLGRGQQALADFLLGARDDGFEYFGIDPVVRASVLVLFRDVANTWIPDDSADELHALKAGALKTAESGELPAHLRVVH